MAKPKAMGPFRVSQALLGSPGPGPMYQLNSHRPCVESVPIITNVVSSYPAHCEMYPIHHCVIKFVIYLRQVGGFLRVQWLPPPIKLTATI